MRVYTLEYPKSATKLNISSRFYTTHTHTYLYIYMHTGGHRLRRPTLEFFRSFIVRSFIHLVQGSLLAVHSSPPPSLRVPTPLSPYQLPRAYTRRLRTHEHTALPPPSQTRCSTLNFLLPHNMCVRVCDYVCVRA